MKNQELIIKVFNSNFLLELKFKEKKESLKTNFLNLI